MGSPDRSSSKTPSPGPLGDPLTPLPRTRVSPRKPPSFPKETPRTGWIQVYPSDWSSLRAYLRRIERSRFPPRSTGADPETGKGTGGRPPVAAEAFRALLREAGVLPGRPRAPARLVRAVKVDEAAREGFRRLWRRDPKGLLAFPEVRPVVQAATGADRPSRIYRATAELCEWRLIAALDRGPHLESTKLSRTGLVSTRDLTPRPVLVETALPSLVPDYLYAWGPAVYQTTLEEHLS